MSRSIVHLDADAFFASVEQAADTRLRGKPVAVGGESRGIIASASYEARKFGIYTPMPTGQARKLCPKLIVLPGHYDLYEEFSNGMFAYAYDFTPDVERTSIDEGYFDLTANHKKPAVEIALTISKAIQQSLKITVSEGVASNKLISQIASKLNKPAAFQSVPGGQEKQFIQPLPNRWLPGIGPKTSARLNAAGLAKILHVAATPIEMLELILGRQAVTIRQFAHGIDERPLVPAREPQKTFSQQETFAGDLTDEEYIAATLRRMADDLFAKVRVEKRTIRTLTVTVRYNDRAEDQVSESLLEPTDLETEVYDRLQSMLKKAWKRRVRLRLDSLLLSNLYDGRFRSDLPLTVPMQRLGAQSRLAAVVDELRSSHGRSIILRGHDFRLLSPPTEALAASPIHLPGRRPIIHAKLEITNYVPLRAHSYYSFLDSTLSPQAIVSLAKQHGMSTVALTDTGNLHGAVEFVQAAQQAGIKPIIGVELNVAENPLLLYVESARGYANLCCLLSRHAKLTDANDDEASVAVQQRRPYRLSELSEFSEGLIAVSSEERSAEIFKGGFYR